MMIQVDGKIAKVARGVTACLFLAAFLFAPNAQPASAQISEVPVFMQEFIKFYSTGNLDEMGRYIHPDRGLTQDGILRTAEEVQGDFKALGQKIGNVDYMKLIFIEGFFPGDSYYRAKTYVEYRTAGYTQQVPTVFVFEKIGEKWYLVQSESVEFIEQFRPFDVLTVGYILPDIELKTNTGRLFKSTAAAEKGKATLLYFFTVLDLFREENTEFFMSIVREFGKDNDIYVFGVTDDDEQYVNNWMAKEGLNFVWLNDEESLLHYDLGILYHPTLLLLDRDARLVTIARWEYDRDKVMEKGYYPPAHDLIKRRIRDVLSAPAGSI